MGTPASAIWNSPQWNEAMFGAGPRPAGTAVQLGEGLLYPALRKANITIGPQRTPSPAQFQDAIEELNRLIGSLNCDPLNIWAQDIQTFPLQAGKKSYTIGRDPQGILQADFDAERPHAITYANTILLSSGQPLRFPLQLFTDQQWASVRLQDIGNTIPWALYNDRAHPISTLYLYGQPIADMQLELYTWHQIPVFAALTDVVIVPPGYEDALVLNLACRLAPHFQRVINPDVVAQARESLMRVESYNAPKPILDVNGLCRVGDRSYSMIAGAGGQLGLNDPTQSLGDLLVRGSSAVNRLPIGNPGDILMADPASWLGVRWAVPVMAGVQAVQSVFGRTGDIIAQAGDYTVDMIPGAMADPLTTVGDLLVRGSVTTRLPVGSNGQVLTVDSSDVLGMRWMDPAAGPGGGDGGGGHPWDQPTPRLEVAGDVNIIDPGGINGYRFRMNGVPIGVGGVEGGEVPSFFVNDGFVGTRSIVNFLAGSNVNISGIDNTTTGRIDITISSTGGGGPGGGQNQTPWESDINGATFMLSNAGGIAVGFGPPAIRGRIELQTTNTPGYGFRHKDFGANGYPGFYAENNVGESIGFFVGGSGSGVYRMGAITTGTSAIPIAFHTAGAERMRITAGRNVGIGNAADVMPVDVGAHAGTHLLLGDSTSPLWTQFTMLVNQPSGTLGGGVAGAVNFANYALSASEKRIATIVCNTEEIATGAYGGSFAFWTAGDDGLGLRLKILHTGNVGIGNDASFSFFGESPVLFIGQASGNAGHVVLVGNTTNPDILSGSVSFYNNAISGSDRHFAYVAGVTEGAVNSGALSFGTMSLGIIAERMRLTSTGSLILRYLPTTDPGAGTRQLWADPADNYRVKYAI